MIQTNPEVTVIIPVFNEEVGINKLLDGIIELKLNDVYEILVVNDGSSDNSLEVIKKYPVKVYSHNVNKGYGAAIKTGIRKAHGEKIIILDSDGQHDPAQIPLSSVYSKNLKWLLVQGIMNPSRSVPAS